MVPHQDERGEPRPSEAAEVPGDRLQQEQQKELASLDQQDASDTEMDEKRQAALMTSLEHGETGTVAAAHKYTVCAASVRKLRDLLLIPAAEVEAALQQAEGDYVKATQLLLEQEI
ncbi:hypothetical protein, conserved [Eimeria necatrix]|uniref:Nascent polypeptide-associated complex subunit alpha-like UBA domain-containing protein n=1 Tax=Eimeria necatrix TaxID=51315 RepID=U6MQK0_9EIME|nr:hypothetical protein, conserved [Eimeria necatrix]CDJ63935.1 hypothetical protein, conserved [Eimeria necatrix]